MPLIFVHIVFDFKMRGYKGKLWFSLKFMPLIVGNQKQMAVCTVSRSTCKTPVRSIYAYHKGKESIRYRYSFGNRQWIPEPVVKLNQMEWDILKVSNHGIKGEEAAKIIGVSHSYLRSVQSAMFEKLEVDNMTQALIFIPNHRIVVEPNQRQKQQPKIRKKMTPEKLQRIQEQLNNGESVNSIAIQEEVSESNIRYHLNAGKLKRS